MKTSKEDIYDHMTEQYGADAVKEASTNTLIDMILQSLVDLEMPEIEDKIERYEGTQFADLGKLKLLEEIQEEVNT